jgi:hypothetical protein
VCRLGYVWEMTGEILERLFERSVRVRVMCGVYSWCCLLCSVVRAGSCVTYATTTASTTVTLADSRNCAHCSMLFGVL